MPGIPNINDINRSKRAALDRLSYKNVVSNRTSSSPAKKFINPVIAPPQAPIFLVDENAQITMNTDRGTLVSKNGTESELKVSFNVEGNIMQLQEFQNGDEAYLQVTMPNENVYNIFPYERTTLYVGTSAITFFYDPKSFNLEDTQ